MAYTVFATPQILPRFIQENLKVSERLLNDDVNHGRRAGRSPGRVATKLRGSKPGALQKSVEGLWQVTMRPWPRRGGVARSGSGYGRLCARDHRSVVGYAEEVMRHSSEASRALLRPRSFSEIFEVEAELSNPGER
jgi:hypothetical protein